MRCDGMPGMNRFEKNEVDCRRTWIAINGAQFV
jgi:hypothetical protein